MQSALVESGGDVIGGDVEEIKMFDVFVGSAEDSRRDNSSTESTAAKR
jgi:hypothetical protein